MKKIIIKDTYQIPAPISTPVIPTEFWSLMGWVQAEVVIGKEPERPYRLNRWQDPIEYHAVFHFWGTTVVYEWVDSVATVTLFGNKREIGRVERIVLGELTQGYVTTH